MKAVNLNTGRNVSTQVVIADTFMSRFLGLIPRKTMGEEEGLLLDPCSSIHMFFMSFSIDAVFLDKDFKVLRIFENLKPWRITPFIKNAESVLELPAGRCKGRVSVGDRLEFTADVP